MKKYTINFAGDITIAAESEALAMVYFRNWLRLATGDVDLDGYNCVNEEEIEE